MLDGPPPEPEPALRTIATVAAATSAATTSPATAACLRDHPGLPSPPRVVVTGPDPAPSGRTTHPCSVPATTTLVEGLWPATASDPWPGPDVQAGLQGPLSSPDSGLKAR